MDNEQERNYLQEALLASSPNTETTTTPPRDNRHHGPNWTPSSAVGGNVEESPSLSFLETSFYVLEEEPPSRLSFLKNLYASRRDDDDDDDDDEDIVEQEAQDDLEIHPFIRYWNRGIARFHGAILLVIVLLVWPFGFISYDEFHQHTDSTFNPLPGTLSAAAQAAFESAYSHQDWQDPMKNPPLVLVLDTKNCSLTRPSCPAFTRAQSFALNMSRALNSQCWFPAETNCTNATTTTSTQDWLQVTSYYSLEQDGLDWLARAMATRDGHSTFIQIQYMLPVNFTGDEKRLIDSLLHAVEEYSTTHGAMDYFDVKFTGIHWFQADMVRSTRADILRMDVLVLPVALFLIGVVLQPRANPWFVWMVPLMTMVTTVAIWSIVMRQVVVRVIQITQFTPTLMMSLTLGMGVDYTLFLLARYDLPDNTTTNSKSRAIGRMLNHGGNVVLLSGLTLMCTFLGLCFLPLHMLQSVGIGAAVAIASALLVNLTLVPALLYTSLGNWIVRHHDDDDDDDEKEHGDCMVDGTTRAMLVESSNNSMGSADAQLENVTPSFWYRLSQLLVHPSKGIIILLVVLQLLVPVAFWSLKAKSSLSFDLLLPSNSPSLETFHELAAHVGPGRLNPYRILFDGREANLAMTTATGFDVMNRVIEKLWAIDDGTMDYSVGEFDSVKDMVNHLTHNIIDTSRDLVDMDSTTPWGKDHAREPVYLTGTSRATVFNGISVVENKAVPHSAYVAAKFCALTKHCPFQLLRVIDKIDQISTARGMHATFVTATLGVSPFSDAGIAWLKAARTAIQELSESDLLNGVQVHIQGLASIEYDAMNAVYSVFPTMVVLTTLVIFALMGIFFKSLFAPIRSVVSIGLSLSFSFGLGVLTYQNGAFNWLQLRPLASIDGGFCWLVPIMAFSIIVGLALDYDVFLISRILELRKQGFEHKTSIAVGLYSTGRIITAAGGIMAMAFGSLMLSSSPVLYQWSFLLTTAVLLDTFVVRTLVVPVLTSLGGKWCWWPRELPEARVYLTCFQESFVDDDMRSLLRSLEETSEYEPIARSPLRETTTSSEDP